MLKITSGKYRAKKLFSPTGDAVRPTGERARQAIFNILYSKIGTLEGKSFLDVFAGSGAMGFEALSRGAESVCLIDKDTQYITKNAALFRADMTKINIIQADIARLPQAQKSYDIVFSDAPYDKGLNETAMQNLILKGFLKNDSVCILEVRHNEEIILPHAFEIFDQRIYGMAKVYFYIFREDL